MNCGSHPHELWLSLSLVANVTHNSLGSSIMSNKKSSKNSNTPLQIHMLVFDFAGCRGHNGRLLSNFFPSLKAFVKGESFRDNERTHLLYFYYICFIVNSLMK